MNRIFILTLIFMKASFSFAQEVKLNHECNPTFKEIFNFQVGDYFNYQINTWQEWLGNIDKNESYTITKKEEHGDTVYYVRKGKGTKVEYDIRSWPTDHPYYITKYEIYDTLVYVDSAKHFLNLCPDTLIQEPLLNFCEESDYYTSVQVVQNDSMLTKIIGVTITFMCMIQPAQ
jgi:hypothetical protein